MTSRELHWKISEQDFTVRIEESKGHGTFHISGRGIAFRVLASDWIEIDGKRHRFYVLRDRNDYTVWLDGHTYRFSGLEKGILASGATAATTGEITPLMPGKILRIEVTVGDMVAEKQALIIMESMKMESALRAPKSGRVAEIRCQPGQVVEMGEVLLVISP